MEGLVIVSSILLAFAIDAAWDARQENRFRDDLLAGLRTEFAANRDQLATAGVNAARIRDSFAGLRSGAHDPGSVPVDSMRRMAGRALVTVEFRPQLSAYRSAVASGGPRLIRRPELWRALSRFNQAYDYYAEHNRLYREIYFLGPVRDIRREIGTIRALYAEASELPPPLVLDDSAYLDFVSRRDVLSNVEGAYYASIAVSDGIQWMARQADSVLAALER